MNIRFLTVLITVAFLGLSISVPAFAGKDKGCDTGSTHPSCGDDGGGGDDHGDPPARYYVELIEGGFYFPEKVVTRNNRGNSYSSTKDLEMVRVGSEFPSELATDTVAWDEVFSTCPAVYPVDNPILTVKFGDDWSIDNSGGNSAGDVGSRVTLAFRNGYAVNHPEVEIDLFLVGTLPEPGIPASSEDDPIKILLEKFSFYVHAHGNDSCKITGEFVLGYSSMLMMTWYVPPPSP